MEGLSDLFTFIGAMGDEVFNIFAGEGQVSAAPTSLKIRPVVVAGPSGVGKGTLISRLMEEHPNCFRFSVSHTTRGPRPGEKDTVDYHFTTVEKMLAMIEDNQFLESAKVHDNIYGTSKTAVSNVAAEGKICILDIDVQGVESVKNAALSPTPLFIFVKPPSMEALEARLRGRGTETEEKIQARLKGAAAELAYADADEGANFDAVFVNDDLDKCYAEIKEALTDNLKAVVMFHRRAAAKAEAAAAAAAEADAAAEGADAAPAAEAPAAAPAVDPADEVKALIKQKEEQYDAANAAKNRALAKQLLEEIEGLEGQLAQ